MGTLGTTMMCVCPHMYVCPLLSVGGGDGAIIWEMELHLEEVYEL